jgi:hypothetical protein
MHVPFEFVPIGVGKSWAGLFVCVNVLKCVYIRGLFYKFMRCGMKQLSVNSVMLFKILSRLCFLL